MGIEDRGNIVGFCRGLSVKFRAILPPRTSSVLNFGPYSSSAPMLMSIFPRNNLWLKFFDESL